MNLDASLVALSDAELATVSGGDYFDELDESWLNGDITADEYWTAFDLEMDRRIEQGFYP